MDVKCPGVCHVHYLAQIPDQMLAQDASAFPLSSLTRRPLSSATHVPAYCVSLRVAGRGSLRVCTVLYNTPNSCLHLSFRELIPSEELSVHCHVSSVLAVCATLAFWIRFILSVSLTSPNVSRKHAKELANFDSHSDITRPRANGGLLDLICSSANMKTLPMRA
jgi:hypothetical protein